MRCCRKAVTSSRYKWVLPRYKGLDPRDVVTRNTITSRNAATIMESKQAWKEIAEKKRSSILNSIPREWRLSEAVLDGAKAVTDLTGSFIESLLDDESRTITRLSSIDLLQSIANGTFSAHVVVRAFCKRTAFAHQLVSAPSVHCMGIG